MTETIDTAAALAEGLADMPADLIPLRDEYLALKEERDNLVKTMDSIKGQFADYIKDNGLQGLILEGKVHARVSNVTNSRVDSKRLKAEMPTVHAKFLIVTKSQRVTVN